MLQSSGVLSGTRGKPGEDVTLRWVEIPMNDGNIGPVLAKHCFKRAPYSGLGESV